MDPSQKQAFKNPSGELFHLSEEQIGRGIEASRKSSRKRIILPIHRKQEALVQRIINFLQPGTYIRPHKHPLPHATETIVMLRGAIRFFTFDDGGNITSDRILDSSPVPGLLDIEPDTWHSFVVKEPDTILFECKKGPYNAETDKTFAEWAPEEGTPEAENYLKELTS